jgi:hypothetical protein
MWHHPLLMLPQLWPHWKLHALRVCHIYVLDPLAHNATPSAGPASAAAARAAVVAATAAPLPRRPGRQKLKVSTPPSPTPPPAPLPALSSATLARALAIRCVTVYLRRQGQAPRSLLATPHQVLHSWRALPAR